MATKKNKIISYKRFKNRMLKLRANDPRMVEFYRVCLNDPDLRANDSRMVEFYRVYLSNPGLMPYVDVRGILRLVYKYWGCCNVCSI